MGRCYSCCQENCGYSKHCACTCHLRDYQTTYSDPSRPCATCGAPSELTGANKCRPCDRVETQVMDYLIRGKRKARNVLKKLLAPKVAVKKKRSAKR